MAEKAYEKHAWILLFAAAIVVALIGLLLPIIGGGSTDPDFPAIAGITHDEFVSSNPQGVVDFFAFTFRVFGFGFLGFGVVTMAIALKSYRNGEKWAWYALWSFPVIFGFVAATGLSAGAVSWPLFAVLLIVALVGLLLPYRKFFPKS